MGTWQNAPSFAVWLASALFIVILLAGSMIAFTRMYFRKQLENQAKQNRAALEHRRMLINSVLETREIERNRIAGDLHDGLIPHLNALMYIDFSNENTTRIKDIIAKSITIARGISHDLSPPLIKQIDLIDLIADFIDPLKSKFNIQCNQTNAIEAPLAVDIKLHLFRIVQEVVNNSVKHSKASKIDIIFRQTQRYLSLIISDNGVGFDVNKSAGGLGLKNIEARVMYLQGRYKFRSRPGNGVSFIFTAQSVVN